MYNKGNKRSRTLLAERDKNLEIAKAFLPKDKEIEKIIQLCNLFPIKNSWNNWTDNLGNFIFIYKNKISKSFSQDPLQFKNQIITDIYFKSCPKKIASISFKAFILIGTSEINQINTCLIFFLGKDLKLRMVVLKNGIWLKNCGPLTCGIDIVRHVIKNFFEDSFIITDILNIDSPVAAKMIYSWNTDWPPKEELFNSISDKSLNISNIIKEIC